MTKMDKLKNAMKGNVSTTEELNLKIDKDDLLDSHVLTPHNELNSVIYDAVDRFLERSNPKKMVLCIHTQKFSDILQEKIKELYREHYHDEMKELGRQLKYVYFRIGILLFLAIFLLSFQIYFLNSNDSSLPTVVIGSIGSYFLWKIGDVIFSWIELSRKTELIRTAYDADFAFQFHSRPKERKE